MASSPRPRKIQRDAPPLKDRRAPDGGADPLRKLKGALVRPIVLQRRGGKLQLALAERRAPPAAAPAATAQALCAELSARLLAHQAADEATQTMRHLIFVHDALERRGWFGVESLAPQVLNHAIAQAETLANDEPSATMDTLTAKLRALLAAATVREQRESLAHDFRVGDNLEVSESDYAQFEDAEQSWSGTVPADLLPPPERDD